MKWETHVLLIVVNVDWRRKSWWCIMLWLVDDWRSWWCIMLWLVDDWKRRSWWRSRMERRTWSLVPSTSGLWREGGSELQIWGIYLISNRVLHCDILSYYMCEHMYYFCLVYRLSSTSTYLTVFIWKLICRKGYLPNLWCPVGKTYWRFSYLRR